LEEYPPADTPSSTGPVTVHHAGTWSVLSGSVTTEPVRIELAPARGAAGPTVVGPAGLVRVLAVVPPGARLSLAAPATGSPVGAPPTVEIAPPGRPPRAVARAVVRVEPAPGYRPDDVLVLPVGGSTWRYVDCVIARFGPGPGCARFDGDRPEDRFAGPPFRERAVFGVSRFATADRPAVFDTAHPAPDQPVAVTTGWLPHRPGTLRVTLPLDPDEPYGARSRQARFPHPQARAEALPA